jgi:hypothetical protein
MKKIRRSQVFKPLKEAIETLVNGSNNFGEPEEGPEFAIVRRSDLNVLRLVYNEFFVEPEDDKEWNEYQSK